MFCTTMGDTQTLCSRKVMRTHSNWGQNLFSETHNSKPQSEETLGLALDVLWTSMLLGQDIVCHTGQVPTGRGEKDMPMTRDLPWNQTDAWGLQISAGSLTTQQQDWGLTESIHKWIIYIYICMYIYICIHGTCEHVRTAPKINPYRPRAAKCLRVLDDFRGSKVVRHSHTFRYRLVWKWGTPQPYVNSRLVAHPHFQTHQNIILRVISYIPIIVPTKSTVFIPLFLLIKSVMFLKRRSGGEISQLSRADNHACRNGGDGSIASASQNGLWSMDRPGRRQLWGKKRNCRLWRVEISG